MTDQEQIIALAEFEGWERTDEWRSGWMKRTSEWPKGLPGSLPNYLNDLNAVHELEEKLTDKKHLAFQLNLRSAVHVQGSIDSQLARYYISATARQRCEALLKTIGKWKD